MSVPLRTRLALLVGLAALGVALGVGASSLGVGGPALDDEPAAEFTVSDDGVVVADEREDATVVEDMSRVDAVELEATDDGIAVTTAERDPLSDHDRQRAKRIAAENETVRTELATLAAADLRVEPVRRLNATRAIDVELETDGTTPERDDGETMRFDARWNGTAGDEGRVAIERDPEYVDDRAVVTVVDPADGTLYYRVHVDLEAGAVDSIGEPATIRARADDGESDEVTVADS